MPDRSSELAYVFLRLELLEKQNQKMKRAALSLLALISCAVLMGQAHRSQTIEAQRFVVKDANGKIRAVFGMQADDPGGATLRLGSGSGGYDDLPNAADKYAAILHGGDYAWLNLRSADSMEYVNARLASDPETGPQISLSDRNFYETNIGVTELVTTRTGKQHRTSAASVVLFGKDKNVLWSAP